MRGGGRLDHHHGHGSSHNGVCRVPSKASDGHSENVYEVIALFIRKGKGERRHCPNVMKVRWPAMSSLKTPDKEICHSMLQMFMPPELNFFGKIF